LSDIKFPMITLLPRVVFSCQNRIGVFKSAGNTEVTKHKIALVYNL